MYLIAVVDPKAKVAAHDAPNQYFKPDGWGIATALFFLAATVMVLLIIKAGKGKDYGD